MAKVELIGFLCERCGHTWIPRDKEQEPRVCPKCKSPYWNRPRRTPNNNFVKDEQAPYEQSISNNRNELHS